jgi:hypothetical protein
MPLPFSNTLPGLAIVILAVSMMELDGILVWAGYALSLGAVAYVGAAAGLLFSGAHRLMDAACL